MRTTLSFYKLKQWCCYSWTKQRGFEWQAESMEYKGKVGRVMHPCKQRLTHILLSLPMKSQSGVMSSLLSHMSEREISLFFSYIRRLKNYLKIVDCSDFARCKHGEPSSIRYRLAEIFLHYASRSHYELHSYRWWRHVKCILHNLQFCWI